MRVGRGQRHMPSAVRPDDADMGHEAMTRHQAGQRVIHQRQHQRELYVGFGDVRPRSHIGDCFHASAGERPLTESQILREGQRALQRADILIMGYWLRHRLLHISGQMVLKILTDAGQIMDRVDADL